MAKEPKMKTPLPVFPPLPETQYPTSELATGYFKVKRQK
jgi:hypothetical protein